MRQNQAVKSAAGRRGNKKNDLLFCGAFAAASFQFANDGLELGSSAVMFALLSSSRNV